MKIIPARMFNLLRFLRLVILTGSIVFTFLSPQYIFAATTSCPSDQTMTEVGCLPKDPIKFVGSFYNIGLGLIGGVALIFIIIGGYTILTSRGNPNQINIGKSYIFYAFLGLLLAVFGYLFIEVFAVDILQLPGFSR